jgi:O-antigen ligase/Flp pilus assembly protein TadD
MSASVLLKAAAFATLFYLILLHPLRPDGATADPLCRAVIAAAVASGLVVAAVGVIEFFDWNGKILWIFVPFDWGKPQPGALGRALGPFVNPDHFGDYLAMVLPLAAGGVMFRSGLFRPTRAFRVFSAVALFMIVCALLLSLSRGAWIAAVIAIAVLFSLGARMPAQARPRLLDLGRGKLLRLAIVVAAALLTVALLFIGPQGREQVDLRLRETVYNDGGFRGRLELAADTLAMVRDYPAVGVGLGAWPELFPRYRRAPWSAVSYREAHNDYVQLLAEAGIVGFVLLGWFFVALGRRVYRAAASANAVSPATAVSCAALAAAAFHEFFDFSLRTPANAVLFAALLALAARTADGSAAGARLRPRGWMPRTLTACASAAAAVLAVCALTQGKIPYPYDIERPASPRAALALIEAHPAEAAPHVEMVRLAGEQLSAAERLRALRAAVRLDPTDPYPRDLYARALLQAGSAAQALDNITRSVTNAPSLSLHLYRSSRFIPRLSSPEKRSVEAGFDEAIRRGYGGAVEGLAGFDEASGHFADAAAVYRKAAEHEVNSQKRQAYLFGAGIACARANDLPGARALFQSAIRNQPTDARPYVYLTTMVLGPLHQLKAAQAAIAEGVRAGADGLELYAALAAEAQADGDAQATEAALRDAVDVQPTFDSYRRLGLFYLNAKNYGRAALNLRRATEANPRAADAYFNLGLAEEDDYRFSEAERDFSSALRLAPDNAAYRTHYMEFERKVARGVADAQTADR